MKDLRVLGRVTQGVRLINIGDKDEIASVAKINYIPGDEEELDENGNPIITVELDENGNPIAVIPPSEGSELMNTIIDRAMDDAVINPINSDEELDNIEDKLGKEEEEDLGDDVPPVE
jgi:DNA gyrase subunit A